MLSTDYVNEMVQKAKAERLALWTRRLEEAERAGDQKGIKRAESEIWYINQNY